MVRPPVVCLVLPATILSLAGAAFGQSFNIDIGPGAVAPPDTYAGAGQPGHWESLPATQGVDYNNLVDINGVTTGVGFTQVGGTQTLTVADPALSGSDAQLMNDYLVSFTTIENCLFFNGMEPGTYEVIIYARMPAQPTVFSLTNVDEEVGNPHLLAGGVWPGQHEEGISYSVHIAEVDGSLALGMHSGVPPEGNLEDGAALNGVQIRKIGPCGDGVVDPGEECDDENNLGGDGCSSDCRNEGCVALGGDTDGDTLCDDQDPCKNFANTLPLVISGFSGIPDECLCGDFDGNGSHSATDAAAINACAGFVRSDCVSERDEVAPPFDGFYSATDAALVNRVAAFIDPAYALTCGRRPEGTCGVQTGVSCGF